MCRPFADPTLPTAFTVASSGPLLHRSELRAAQCAEGRRAQGTASIRVVPSAGSNGM